MRWTSLPVNEQLKLVEHEINNAIRDPYVPTVYPKIVGDERMVALKELRRKLLDRRPAA